MEGLRQAKPRLSLISILRLDRIVRADLDPPRSLRRSPGCPYRARFRSRFLLLIAWAIALIAPPVASCRIVLLCQVEASGVNDSSPAPVRATLFKALLIKILRRLSPSGLRCPASRRGSGQTAPLADRMTES